MSSLAIKNYAIALEALSRIPDSCNFRYEIEDLLRLEIKKEKEYHERLDDTKYSENKPAPTKDDVLF